MKKLLIALFLLITASLNAMGNEQISLDTTVINEKLQQMLRERLESKLAEISYDSDDTSINTFDIEDQLMNEHRGNVLITE